MPDEPSGRQPSGQTKDATFSHSPPQTTLEQRVTALESEADARKQHEPSDELASVVKKGEWWLIGLQAATLIATVIIAVIYYAQLKEMVGVSGQTDALTRAY